MLDYTPSPTVANFMMAKAFVRLLEGPVGSGKTTGSILELFREASLKLPSPDGIRRSKWVIIRNTYKQLDKTTVASFFQLVPKTAGKWLESKREFIITADGMEMQFIFMALDTPEDVGNLLSLEVTGAWIEEAREVPEEIFEALKGRVGRYPSVIQGGCEYPFIIISTNPPVLGHWTWRLIEEDSLQFPDTVKVFVQPPAVIENDDGVLVINPEAENLENLPAGYYENQMHGATKAYVSNMLRNKYAMNLGGTPVFPEFDAEVHVSDKPLRYFPEEELMIGLDTGLSPAAAIGQVDAWGQLRVLGEVLPDVSMGMLRFVREKLRPYLFENYPGMPFSQMKIIVDPAGKRRADSDELTPIQVLESFGFRVVAAPTNYLTPRLEAVKSVLIRRIETGTGTKRGIVLDPRATKLKMGLAGGYRFRTVIRTGEPSGDPEKNGYSHVCDACQYLVLGSLDIPAVTAPVQHYHRPAARLQKGGNRGGWT